MKATTVTIGCGMIEGVDAVPVYVEATTRHAGDGTPRLLGLVDACVREAYHRVLQAFFALELPAPRGVITVNFAPAALKKRGSGFDLPLALALAGAAGLFPRERAAGLFAFGEVSLQGLVLPARGAISVALAARRQHAHAMLCSPPDASTCAVVEALPVHGTATLADAVGWLAGQRDLSPSPAAMARAARRPPVADLGEIRGHATPKLALQVAAAGRHNLAFSGPPGTGKSAMLQRLPGLLPPLTPPQQLEVLQVHAAAGLALPPPELPPLRAPHHTSSVQSVLGGGAEARPGEVTLAHQGVLFLDELPEFRRDVLEALRQPLEDGAVTVGRAQRTVTMPARFLLTAARNPCPCGYLGHRSRPCRCTPAALTRYHRRLSGPLLDRLDLHVDVPAMTATELARAEDPMGSTAALREAVLLAHARQLTRNRDSDRRYVPNGQLSWRAFDHAACATSSAWAALDEQLTQRHESPRGRLRVLRVARTLADLSDRDVIEDHDILQASSLRSR